MHKCTLRPAGTWVSQTFFRPKLKWREKIGAKMEMRPDDVDPLSLNFVCRSVYIRNYCRSRGDAGKMARKCTDAGLPQMPVSTLMQLTLGDPGKTRATCITKCHLNSFGIYILHNKVILTLFHFTMHFNYTSANILEPLRCPTE